MPVPPLPVVPAAPPAAAPPAPAIPVPAPPSVPPPPPPAAPPPLPLPPAPPSGCDGGTHAPDVQTLPAAQSPVVEQLVRQASPEAHVYAPHDSGTTMRQVPPPLHVRAGIEVALMQLAAAQTVPVA